MLLSFAKTCIGLVTLLRVASSAAVQQPLNQDPSRPNIIFILTDDQDLQMNSLAYMPLLKKHLIDQGGYPKFISQGLNEDWLPVWLQEAGYNTYYVGKLLNAHSVSNYNQPFAKGFTGSDFLLDPYTYQYLNATFQRNHEAPVNYHGEYSTDVTAGKAYSFLEDAIPARDPFFLTIATSAPHSDVTIDPSFFGGEIHPGSIKLTTPVSAKRHQHLFNDTVVPRTPGFNPETPSGVAWVARLERQNQTVVDSNDHFYRQRLRALQAVDEIVEGVINRITDAGLLDNTYIFYSSDNGYHIGQHRLAPGKECGFEEDINVPLIVRGPGTPKGFVSNLVTSHTDLAPTFLSLIDAPLRPDFDGVPIPLTNPVPSPFRQEHVNIEFWGFGLSEGDYGQEFHWNNTYKGLRIIGDDYNLYYSVWCHGEHELYDLNNDPHELFNLYTTNHSNTFTFTKTSSGIPSRSSPTNLKHLIARLDSLVMVLKTCKGRQCTHPWEQLHPTGNVMTLHDALAEEYNVFYEQEQERVKYTRCEQGYILEAEGPNRFKSIPIQDIGARGGRYWAELV